MSPASPRRVLTAGETMALLDPLADGVGLDARFRLTIAGAESNLAIALRRLGVEATWASALGRDPFGDLVWATLAAEGVDLSLVRREPSRPTGAFFKLRGGGRSEVRYYRAGSAAATLVPGDVPDTALDAASLVHLTGITLALGAGPAALVASLAERAAARGLPVVFDPNFRPALWPDAAAARAAQEALLPRVSWYLCGLDEGRLLWGARDAGELFAALAAAGVARACVRVGAEGALLEQRGSVRLVPPSRREEVVDDVGAGDAFAAGFCYGLLQGWAPTRCVRMAHLLAGRVLRGSGDWETLPRLAQIELPAP